MNILIQLLAFIAVTYSGIAPYYNPGKMERVSRIRGMPLVACMVSSPYEPLGTILSVYGSNTGTTLECRVTDVSGPRDRARHIKKGYAVELDYISAGKICGKGFAKRSPKSCPVKVTVLRR